MEKVENKEVEQYIKNTIASMIDSNKLFEKVYGRNFAKRRLAQNLKKVYTNEYKLDNLGYYFALRKIITICIFFAAHHPQPLPLRGQAAGEKHRAAAPLAADAGNPVRRLQTGRIEPFPQPVPLPCADRNRRGKRRMLWL